METMYTMNFTEKELEIICEQLALKPFVEVAQIIGRIQQEYAIQTRDRETIMEEVAETIVEEEVEN